MTSYLLDPDFEHTSEKAEQAATLVWMSPTAFLRLARTNLGYSAYELKVAYDTPDHERRFDVVEGKMSRGVSLDPLYVHYNLPSHSVTAVDGVHRATVARRLHIDRVPVVVYWRKGSWTPAAGIPIETRSRIIGRLVRGEG